MKHHLVSSAISCPVELLALRYFLLYESVCSVSPLNSQLPGANSALS